MALTASLPRECHLRSLSAHGFHRVVYYEWGEHDNPDVVLCVHGIGRNGRDFDVLGELRRDYWAIPWLTRYIWGATAAMLLILERTLAAGD
jgi:hypothetical protein